MAEPRFFPYDLDTRFVGVWFPLGVRRRHGVTVDERNLTATFGPALVRTPIENVRGGHVTEGYRWWSAAGIRLSGSDDGLTFGTTNRRGVCLHFHEPVAGPIPGKRHSALTVTVRDCAGLVDLLGTDEPS